MCGFSEGSCRVADVPFVVVYCPEVFVLGYTEWVQVAGGRFSEVCFSFEE